MAKYERHFDGREMVMVHDVFRREFGLLPAVVRAVADGDVARAQVVADHIDLVAGLLHHHHQAEDDSVWPLLLVRCPEQIVPLIQLMEDQHASVAATGRKVSEALAGWRAGAAPGARSVLAGALERLLPVLTEHLALEEERVVPVMELHIGMDEWTQILEKGMAGLDLDGLPLLFGLLCYEGDPEIVEGVLATLPAQARGGMLAQAQQAYGQQAEVIYGTATPPRRREV
jgi:hemerythrin-like domain-containing protein